jgi:hypothetical protein
VKNITYTVRRNVEASNRPGGPQNCRIAMMIFSHPKSGQPTMLGVNEEMIAAQSGGDPGKEKEVIEREIKTVLSQMTAGAEFIPILQ